MKLRVSPIFDKNRSSTAKILVNRGGTRSSKTYSISQLEFLFLTTGLVAPVGALDQETIQKDSRLFTHGGFIYLKEGMWSTVRKSLPSLRASAVRDFEEIYKDTPYLGKIKVNKSEMTFRYGPRTVEFFSIDNQQKVRSRKRDILFCNEGNELDYMSEFYQLLLRTKYRTYIDFNPDQPDTWIRTEIEEKRRAERGDVEVIQSWYKDNPFLTREEIREIEYMIQVDPFLWQVFGKGEYGEIRGKIYNNVVVQDFDEFNFEKPPVFGLDFGYNDPFVILKGWHNDGKVYVKEVYYDRYQTPDDVLKASKDEIDNHRVIADRSRPDSITDLKRKGVNIRGYEGGKDSRKAGIEWLQQQQLIIHPSAVNTIREVRNYVWIKDSAGHPTEEPTPVNDHAMDALRYMATAWSLQPRIRLIRH